jgi:hypothetical protein
MNDRIAPWDSQAVVQARRSLLSLSDGGPEAASPLLGGLLRPTVKEILDRLGSLGGGSARLTSLVLLYSASRSKSRAGGFL